LGGGSDYANLPKYHDTKKGVLGLFSKIWLSITILKKGYGVFFENLAKYHDTKKGVWGLF
jgi:hypothetical protein